MFFKRTTLFIFVGFILPTICFYNNIQQIRTPFFYKILSILFCFRGSSLHWHWGSRSLYTKSDLLALKIAKILYFFWLLTSLFLFVIIYLRLTFSIGIRALRFLYVYLFCQFLFWLLTSFFLFVMIYFDWP